MMSKYLSLVVLASLQILICCSSYFEISIKGEDPFSPLFKLKKPILSVPIGSKRVDLSDFGVYEKKGDQWDYKNPLWRIVSRSDSRKGISQVEYGKVPSGFQEQTQKKELAIGKLYLVMGFGAGGHGSTEFMIVQEAGSYHIKQGKRLQDHEVR